MAENIQEKVENMLIDSINSYAGGRLIIFKPENNKFGADLIVERRGNYKEGGYFLKINSLVKPASGSAFIKDFLRLEFLPDKNFYLVFAFFDKIRQKINDYIWLIPSEDFVNLADSSKLESGQDILRFRAETDIKNDNKFSKYLVSTKNLGNLILGAFESGGKFNFGTAGQKNNETLADDKL